MVPGDYGECPYYSSPPKDSLHKARDLLQLKNRWAASSCCILQNGHVLSINSICFLLRLDFVGNRSLISLQPKIEASWFKLPTPTISFLFMGPSYFCDWSLCICIDLTLLPHIHLTLLPDITVTKKYVFLQLIFWF